MDCKFKAPEDKTPQEIYEDAIAYIVETINGHARFDKYKADHLYCELSGTMISAFETDDTQVSDREAIGEDIKQRLIYEPFGEIEKELDQTA